MTRREAGRISIRWRGRRDTEDGSKGSLGVTGGKGFVDSRVWCESFLYFLYFKLDS
jgi:hypothetical protein